MTKTHSTAMLSAMLATHCGAKQISAFTAAETAIALTSLANSIVDLETLRHNGFISAWHEDQFAKFTRVNDVASAKTMQSQINEQGDAYYAKRIPAMVRKLTRILAHAEIPASDFRIVGLYGGLKFVGGGRDWAVATE